jgi:hypothetical protein
MFVSPLSTPIHRKTERGVVSELFSGRIAIHILVAEINKVLLAEATLGLNARRDRL